VLDGIQKDTSRAFAQDLRFRDIFGISGVFVAVALTAQICLAVILGFRAEAAYIPAVQVVCLHGIAVFAASKLFNSAVYWRSLVEGLYDVQEGNVDPLEAWNKVPAAKRLKKWHNANFAIDTGGKYSLLLIIGPEVFELMVQATNANRMAGYVDWPALSFYGTLISINCILFGVCMLSDERFVSDSVIITVDVVMDACYVMFNIFYVSNSASYWAIIVPLALSVNALSKGFKRHGLESVNHALFKQNVQKKNDESKANGSFEHDAVVELAKRFNAGAENNRREIRPPSGFDEFAPRLFTEDSGDVSADALMLEDLVAAPPDLEMLNASFCGVDDITGEQAVELQDRNMVLHGNPVTEITWAYQNELTKIPAWLRTLEKVWKADLGYCDVKEMKGGAFPVSLEELTIKNQVAGLRLHPDSFEGLSELEKLEILTNKLTEDDMHPGLFGDTTLVELNIMGNRDLLNFNAAALFPGNSGQKLDYLHLENCGLTGIGGESGTNLHGLLALEVLWLSENTFGNRIAEDAFADLDALAYLFMNSAGVTSLPVNFFGGDRRLLGVPF
ncbi:hypothetical protein TeGR_g5082, partial [Tetraparma gracilis]